MLLTKTFTAETYARALESWAWLEIGDRAPVLASLFGDVFLRDQQGYWFLDSIEGSLALVAPTRNELQNKLDTVEGQDLYLLGALAMAADRRGLHLQANEVYDFEIPPVLGGTTDLDNVVKRDFVVSLNLAGQLHNQVRNLPPGTRITGFELTE